MQLKQKIKERLDLLQRMMESNQHLHQSDEVQDLTYEISKFWSVLSEEDRDYIHAVRHAVEEKMEWNV